jgi:predicted TIM-barrel fold metal-dependent hydrolase
MSSTDVATFIGAYPYRYLPHTDAEWLVGQLDRLEIDRAWVGHLPSILLKDPAPGNAELFHHLESYRDRLLPVPVLHPELPGWERDLGGALERGVPAIRLFPAYQGVEAAGPAMRAVVAGLASAGVPAVLTVGLEDQRQRHPMDVAEELPAAAVRALARCDPRARMIVTHAGRAYIEEVHFGLAPHEASRLLWDISQIWGPPEDHLQVLLETVGSERFVFGTGMPLRIPDTSLAKLDLLDVPDSTRIDILGQNLSRFLSTR